MEELNDKDFDQIFKNRIKDGYLEFEEDSWLKMEKKLRARNRYVFLRNASIILLFLSFGIGIYKMSSETAIKDVKITKNSKATPKSNIEVLEKNNEIFAEKLHKTTLFTSKNKKIRDLASKNNLFATKQEIVETPTISMAIENVTIDSSITIAKDQVLPQNNPISDVKTDVRVPINETTTPHLKPKRAIALSILLGPDFSSTENTIGGKHGIALGIGLSVPIGKKLSVQTGINYGSKNYEAKGYDYSFNNPNVVSLISAIDASCKVLEIPLRASYNIMDNQKNSIDLSAGLSSYMMLKENYRFIYTQASGRKDRFLEEKNANQHYLSVIDLSATYNVRLKNKKFALGVQPYVKIPISGIGEGSVPLKSSGISLKLNYELIKKK
ncbi:outer membrane beta-barrel protein [Pedobacter sp. Du54]|uniref:outer membrane beta-barrel protein n=1 Tax=Pedobacter anseongensis TaxID=3133439 RepID=UPI003094C32B